MCMGSTTAGARSGLLRCCLLVKASPSLWLPEQPYHPVGTDLITFSVLLPLCSWFVDDVVVREVYRSDRPLPTKPCFLYSSLWDASHVHWGAWAGSSDNLSHAPYLLATEMVQVQWF